MSDTEIQWRDLGGARLRLEVRSDGLAADVTVLNGPNEGSVYRGCTSFPEVVDSEVAKNAGQVIERRLTEVVDVESTHLFWCLDHPEKWASH